MMKNLTGMAVLGGLGLLLTGCIDLPGEPARHKPPVTHKPKPEATMIDETHLRPMRSDDEMARIDFDQARTAGTNAALIMFLARNPTSPYAPQARAALRARHSVDAAGAVSGPDANIIQQFDHARLSGSPAELRAFAARHAGHPLAVEAMIWAGNG